jgi:flagellar hook protein FlgE
MPIPSLFIGSGAITTQQNAISVVANNIANVNTTAFKSSKVSFQDQTANIMKPSSAPTQVLGGTNPTEYGTGVRLASVSTNFGQGSLKQTGIASDLSIQGGGFFVVSGNAVEGQGLKNAEYTRDGHFNVDVQGNLVNSGGQKVYGITFFDTATQQVKSLPGYTGVTFYSDQPIGDTIIDTSAAPPVEVAAGPTAGKAIVYSNVSEISVRGSLIDSTPAIAGDITASREADGRMKISIDQGGTDYETFIDSANTLFSDGVTSFTMEDPATGNQLQLRIRLKPGVTSLESVFTNLNATGDSLTIQAAAAQVDDDITVGADDIEFMSVANVNSLLDPVKLPSFLFTVDTGIEIGTTSYSVESDGTITVVGESSERMKLGRLAMANFKNYDGLNHIGNNNYKDTTNSGPAALSVLGGPFNKSAPSISSTKIVSGALEGSNVNLADEFSEMIALQRGLQASGRTVTSSDEILQTLINL